MRISKTFIFLFLFPLIGVAQILTGRVIDNITQQPIETVAVYFDNTTIGTTTDSNGEFSISYSDAVQSPLVISYLGYKKILISDYRSQNTISAKLVEEENALDEVHIAFDDGLSRRQKLRLFKKEFLGISKFGKSCNILNEEDLILRYSKQNKALYVNAKAPLQILNNALQYKITYDLMDFEIGFRYANLKTLNFTINTVTYSGTSFYKDLDTDTKKSTLKSRTNVYKGSIQHFIRALYNKNLAEEDYWIYQGKFRVNEWDYFTVDTLDNQDLKKVTLTEKVSILFEKKSQSLIQLKTPEFYIDTYGNYTPITGVYFSGVMGSQRLGDTLPLDYGLGKTLN